MWRRKSPEFTKSFPESFGCQTQVNPDDVLSFTVRSGIIDLTRPWSDPVASIQHLLFVVSDVHPKDHLISNSALVCWDERPHLLAAWQSGAFRCPGFIHFEVIGRGF